MMVTIKQTLSLKVKPQQIMKVYHYVQKMEKIM